MIKSKMNLLITLLILLISGTALTYSAETTKKTDIKGHSIQTTSEIERSLPVIQTESVTSEFKTANGHEEEIAPIRAGEQINWQVLSAGGDEGVSTNFKLSGTVGQTAADNGVSTGYNIYHGYWQSFGIILCDCEPGEADNTPPINILDIVYLINYKYKGGPASEPYEICNGDPNKDCIVNILDIVYLINFKYKEGPIPATCEEWSAACGILQK